MKTDNLVNGYVLTNLFYELMFLDESGVQVADSEWEESEFVKGIIRSLVLPRFEAFKDETKQVVKNTLGYLLTAEPDDSQLWDIIWQACSAPVPTPHGIREFMLCSYEVIFPEDSLPAKGDIGAFQVNHNTQIANRLN